MSWVVDDARKCNGTHTITGIALFTTAASGFLLVSEVSINILLILLVQRVGKTSMNFYALIMNIAVADLLTGLVSCGNSGYQTHLLDTRTK